MKKSLAKLIAFEGPDGVGKSSLAEAIVQRLRDDGIAAEGISLPGSETGTLGDHVYRLHHDQTQFGIDSIDPTSLQLFHAAAHVDQIQSQILPHLKQDRWVVLDRYWWSTIVYGWANGADEHSLHLMRQLAKHHWQQVSPLAVFLVDRPFQATDPKTRHIRDLYQRLATEEAERTTVFTITNDKGLNEAVDAVWKELSPHVRNRRPHRRKIPASSPSSPEKGWGQSSGPTVWTRTAPLEPTPVYDSLWRFAAKRQEILFRRLRGEPPPWTDDPVLQKHRFTNAYRAADRVSQYLIRNVIYNHSWEPEDLVFRILLFKLFNKIETWELLEREFGEISWTHFDLKRYARILERARHHGQAIYSSAYIMASPGSVYGYRTKHENHLAMLSQMMEDQLPGRVQEADSLQYVYQLLRGYPSVGPFLAFQLAIDLNYSDVIDFDEMSFVVPGPGARDGIAKCFSDRGGLNEADIIRWVTERQDVEFDRLGISFRRLGDRPLQLIDCQNLFCEVDKYARVHHPEIKGRSDRTRIKQVFSARRAPITLWFPPKWGINHYFENKQEPNRQPIHGDLFGQLC